MGQPWVNLHRPAMSAMMVEQLGLAMMPPFFDPPFSLYSAIASV